MQRWRKRLFLTSGEVRRPYNFVHQTRRYLPDMNAKIVLREIRAILKLGGIRRLRYVGPN